MRYLRMLNNSLAAGALAACYVVALVFQLNPALPVDAVRLGRLAATVGLFYAVHFTVIFYVLLVVRQLLAIEVFSPAWLSIGVLVWLGAAAAAGGAVLMWANLRTFALVLDPTTAAPLARGALALVASAVLFAFVGWLRAWMGRGARTPWALAIIAIAAGSVAAPLALRGPGVRPLLEGYPIDAPPALGTAEKAAKVTLIAVDAGSLDFITRATAEGRLPHFGRLLDGGAVVHLATLHPTSAEAIWAAAATGKLPQKNGVRAAGVYRLARGDDHIQLLPDHCYAHGLLRFGFLSEEPHSSETLRTRTLWSILTTLGIPVGVVGWPMTYPARRVHGYVVSDRYYRLAATPSGIDDPSAVFPSEIEADAASAVELAAGEPAGILLASGVETRHETPGRTDLAYDRIAQVLARVYPTQVSLVRYQSLDPIGHYFLRYAIPSEFGDVTDEERRRFGMVLERHYGLIDDALGRAIAALGADDLLLVVSGYGMEPLSVPGRVLEQLVGDPEISGTHDGAPDGFLLAYGAAVATGRSPARASVVDIVPTVLYFLGLPIGRDMDGYAQTDLFQRRFTQERPSTFIPTYDR